MESQNVAAAMYLAGADRRAKVAALSVGGQGWRTEPHEMLNRTRLIIARNPSI